MLLSQLEEVDATINKLGGPRQEELLDFVNLIRCRVSSSAGPKTPPISKVLRGKLRLPNVFQTRVRGSNRETNSKD